MKEPVPDGIRSLPRGRLRRFLRLSRSDRGLLLRAFILLPLTAAGFRLLGYRRWRFLLEFTLPSRAREPVDAVRIQRSVRLVDAAAREGLSSGTCLERSVVLWWLLRRKAIPAELCIGGRKNGTVFEAHAWVEVGGIPVNDSTAPHLHFSPFDKVAPRQPENAS